jgi:photosystem II stability/assembly factor-like uncharacterized protein
MKKYLFLCLLFCGLFIASEAQWVEQATGFATPNRGIRYVDPVDTNVVWAIAYDGSGGTTEIEEFTRTTNGGALWVANSITGYTGDGLSMISAVDSMNAWIPVWYASGGGTILHTTDGGITWNPQPTATFDAPNGFPNVVHFWDANNGFCMGDPNGGYFEIYTTTDGGTTWTRVPQADIPANSSGEYGTTGLYDVVGNTVWFTTGKGRVYKSIDKGYHWTVASTPNTTDQLIISFQDALTGIVRANLTPFNAYKTTDGGTTWQLLSYSGNFYQNDFSYIPGTTETYIAAGADYTTPFMGISTSVDGGLIWDTYLGTDASQFLTVDFVDNKHGWAGAFNTDATTGGMWKYYGNDFPIDLCAGFFTLFSQSADTVDLNTSGLVNFTDISTGSPTMWLWIFGDGNVATTQNASHTYTAVGTYTVSLHDSTATCVDSYSSQVVVINTAGIEKYNDGAQIEMWPNPAVDYLNISAGSQIDHVELFDGLGQMVLSQKVLATQVKLSTNQMNPGVYFIRVFTENGNSVGRFMINK